MDRSNNSLMTKMGRWFKQPHNFGACCIAGVVLILHVVALFQVTECIYDECATVADVNYILHGDDIDPYYLAWAEAHGYDVSEYMEEGYLHHMSLGRLFFAASISTFGDNSFGWRILPVLFGVAAIVLFYLICQYLSSSKWIPLVATGIFAFENLCFVMSGIAMLDVFGFTLALASCLLYFHKKPALAGIILALAVLAKINTGGFAGLVILGHWLIADRQSIISIVKLIGVSLGAFLVLLPVLDYIMVREIIFPWERIQLFFDIHNDPALAQSPGQYRDVFNAVFPWEWLTAPRTVTIWHDPSYELNTSWTLWGLIVPLVLYMLFETIKRKERSICLFSLLWFVCSYLPWFIIYWSFERVSYHFYFYPIVPALCLAAAYAICRMMSLGWRQHQLALRWGLVALPTLWMVAHFAMFWVMAPIL